MPQLEPLTRFNQFPEYPHGSLPEALVGPDWEDTSWHNDTCPSFRQGKYLCWADWPNDADREMPGGPRFILCELDGDGCLNDEEPLLETDEFHLVEHFVAHD